MCLRYYFFCSLFLYWLILGILFNWWRLKVFFKSIVIKKLFLLCWLIKYVSVINLLWNIVFDILNIFLRILVKGCLCLFLSFCFFWWWDFLWFGSVCVIYFLYWNCILFLFNDFCYFDIIKNVFYFNSRFFKKIGKK